MQTTDHPVNLADPTSQARAMEIQDTATRVMETSVTAIFAGCTGTVVVSRTVIQTAIKISTIQATLVDFTRVDTYRITKLPTPQAETLFHS